MAFRSRFLLNWLGDVSLIRLPALPRSPLSVLLALFSHCEVMSPILELEASGLSAKLALRPKNEENIPPESTRPRDVGELTFSLPLGLSTDSSAVASFFFWPIPK